MRGRWHSTNSSAKSTAEQIQEALEFKSSKQLLSDMNFKGFYVFMLSR
jgi:hypothetical protein